MTQSAVQHSRIRHRRGDGSGKPKLEHRRSERVVMSCYPEDMRDLERISETWNVPLSTLVWAFVMEYLTRARGISLDLGPERGSLRMCMEVALRDRELGPWLRRQIAESAG
jgi:hypothetical protein